MKFLTKQRKIESLGYCASGGFYQLVLYVMEYVATYSKVIIPSPNDAQKNLFVQFDDLHSELKNFSFVRRKNQKFYMKKERNTVCLKLELLDFAQGSTCRKCRYSHTNTHTLHILTVKKRPTFQ